MGVFCGYFGNEHIPACLTTLNQFALSLSEY